jgi:hypothetical protein
MNDPAMLDSFLSNGVRKVQALLSYFRVLTNAITDVPGSTPVNVYEPLQHRVAFAGKNGDSMVVSWNTYIQLPEPTVYYGKSPGDLTAFATSNTSVTYPTSNTWNNHVRSSFAKPSTSHSFHQRDPHRTDARFSCFNFLGHPYRPLPENKVLLQGIIHRLLVRFLIYSSNHPILRSYDPTIL